MVAAASSFFDREDSAGAQRDMVSAGRVTGDGVVLCALRMASALLTKSEHTKGGSLFFFYGKL